MRRGKDMLLQEHLSIVEEYAGYAEARLSPWGFDACLPRDAMDWKEILRAFWAGSMLRWSKGEAAGGVGTAGGGART